MKIKWIMTRITIFTTKAHTYQISQNIKCIIKCTHRHIISFHFDRESLSRSLALYVCSVHNIYKHMLSEWLYSFHDAHTFYMKKMSIPLSKGNSVTFYSQRLSWLNELKWDEEKIKAVEHFFQRQNAVFLSFCLFRLFGRFVIAFKHLATTDVDVVADAVTATVAVDVFDERNDSNFTWLMHWHCIRQFHVNLLNWAFVVSSDYRAGLLVILFNSSRADGPHRVHQKHMDARGIIEILAINNLAYKPLRSSMEIDILWNTSVLWIQYTLWVEHEWKSIRGVHT